VAVLEASASLEGKISRGNALKQLFGPLRTELRIARMLLLLTLLPGLNLSAEEKLKVLWSMDLRSSGVCNSTWKLQAWGHLVGIAANPTRVVVALRCPSAPLTN
jgi:hypothetical protein